MILVQKSPQNLVNVYNNIKSALAAGPGFNGNHPNDNNMRAAISYMIEPTSAKADAIHSALLSFMSTYPGGLLDWADPNGCAFCGYSTAWLFDLLMAYNPEKLSSTEIANLKNFFALSAERLKFNTRDAKAVSGPGTVTVPNSTREGKTENPFPNWYSRYMGPSLAAALVSGNQADVDYWADSGWPQDLFTFDTVTNTYPSDSANRYDLVMYLLAIYPSGANTDSCEGYGYSGPYTWRTNTYYGSTLADGGAYHYAQINPAIMGAEIAYHNGMTGVFTLTDSGTVPALLRNYRRAVQSKTEKDYRPTSLTGHPNIGYESYLWMGYRRYSDPLIDNAVSGASLTPFDISYNSTSDVMQFLGYPRHILYTTGGGATPLPLQPPPPPPPAPNSWIHPKPVPTSFGNFFRPLKPERTLNAGLLRSFGSFPECRQ
jgi:hypothetical protein